MKNEIKWNKANKTSSKVLEKQGGIIKEQTKLFNIDCSLDLFKKFSVYAIKMNVDKQSLFEKLALETINNLIEAEVIHKYKGSREKKTSVKIKRDTVNLIKEYCVLNDIKILDFNCYILSLIK